MEASGIAVSFAVIGRKGRDFLRRRGADIAFEFTGVFETLATPALGIAKAGEIGRSIVGEYKLDGYDAVYLCYNEFKSAISQKVTIEPLVPIVPVVPSADVDPHAAANIGPLPGGPVDFIYEPSKQALLDRLVPMYVEVEVLRALLESFASEHGARMTAMDNATKNAAEMIDKLTLVYNRARQAAITKELMEIIGGAEALKG